MSSKRKNAFDDNCKTSVDFDMLRVIYERGYKFYSLLQYLVKVFMTNVNINSFSNEKRKLQI